MPTHPATTRAPSAVRPFFLIISDGLLFLLRLSPKYTKFCWVVKLSCLEEAQCLEQKNPTKDRKAGQRTAVYDAVARQLRIRLHLLCHGKAGDGAGCGKDGNERDEFNIPKAKCNGNRKHDSGYNDETRSDREDQLARMRVIAAAVERCTEDDEGDRRGRRRNLRDGFEDRRRDRQLHEAAQCPRDCPEDHRIHEYSTQNVQEVKSPAAKGLEDKYAENVIERDDRRNHHGRNCDRRIPKDICDERNAHEDIVAAKSSLNHRAAPRVIRFNAADDDTEDESREEHSARTKDHEQWLKRRPRIGDVDVVEHHEEEEHTKHHTVDMQEFFLTQKARPLHKDTDRHQTEERHDAAERDKKITEHKNASPSIACIITGK